MPRNDGNTHRAVIARKPRIKCFLFRKIIKGVFVAIFLEFKIFIFSNDETYKEIASFLAMTET